MPLPIFFNRYLLLPLLLILTACSPSGESGIEGALSFGDRPLSGAAVEVYLKGEKDRDTLPFTVAESDEKGHYRIALPPGRYYLIAKKKEETEDGRTRMLMAECPVNPVEVGDGMRQLPPFPLLEMGRGAALVAAPGTGIEGRVAAAGAAVAEAFVYIYIEEASGLMGPSYAEAVRTGEDGTFRVDLPAGRYYLAARRRADGSRIGEPAPGDLNGLYPGNPVLLAEGELLQLGDLPVAAIDAEEREKRLAGGKFAPTDTAFFGRVSDPDGGPVSGIYVMAYLDNRMVGKPTHISAPSGADGGFTLYLGSGGTFYLGARSTFGGPLEPGEWVGTFDGRADHSASVAKGERQSIETLTVKEIW